MKDKAETKRKFPWGLCAFLGAGGWVVAIFAIGLPPVAVFLAPVVGVMLGWVIGGIIYLVVNPSD